jgi:hypothetical protein
LFCVWCGLVLHAGGLRSLYLHHGYLSTPRLTQLRSGHLLRVYNWCKRQYQSSCTILQRLWVSIMSLNSKLWIVGAPQKLWHRWGGSQWTSTHQCTIHPSWCTGGCWFTVASEARIQLLWSCVMILNGEKKGNVFMVFIPHDCEPCHMNPHETWFCRCVLCECFAKWRRSTYYDLELLGFVYLFVLFFHFVSKFWTSSSQQDRVLYIFQFDRVPTFWTLHLFSHLLNRLYVPVSYVISLSVQAKLNRFTCQNCNL